MIWWDWLRVYRVAEMMEEGTNRILPPWGMLSGWLYRKESCTCYRTSYVGDIR